jgi:hypothetical protein
LACKLRTNKEVEEEKKVDDWRLGEAMKYFSTERLCKNVHPLDRLMMLMGLLALSTQEGWNILTNFMKSNRKDQEIARRIRLLQAIFLTKDEEEIVIRPYDVKMNKIVNRSEQAQQEEQEG